MDTALPKSPGLTCRLLLKAWCVLEALADRAARSLRVRRFRGEADVRLWALAFPKTQVKAVLQRALGEAFPVAPSVEFLSWRPGGYKGLWGKPLAPVPGENAVCLTRSILTSSYAPRRAEIWLQDGELADELTGAGRGGPFEAKVRKTVREAINANPLLERHPFGPGRRKPYQGVSGTGRPGGPDRRLAGGRGSEVLPVPGQFPRAVSAHAQS